MTPLTADIFYGQPPIARMAVGDKNSLGGKENLPEYDFTVSQKKDLLKIFFPKLQKLSLLKK